MFDRFIEILFEIMAHFDGEQFSAEVGPLGERV